MYATILTFYLSHVTSHQKGGFANRLKMMQQMIEVQLILCDQRTDNGVRLIFSLLNNSLKVEHHTAHENIWRTMIGC